MTQVEGILLWPGMFLYVAVFLMYLSSAVFGKHGLERRAWRLFIVGFLCQTASILWRWYASGRFPVLVSYEHYQFGSWFVGLAVLGGGYAYRQMRPILLGAIPVMLIMLGVGMNTYAEMDPMTPPFRSNWLFIHIGFAWFAWGCFVVAALLGGAYILKVRFGENGKILGRFPAVDVMDELMVKQILFGFVCQGLMIVAGAIWAHQLWGRYWAWDPIETWSLVCWLSYGLVLHLRLMMNWRGQRMAVLAILALGTAIVYFWGIGFMPASHTRVMLFE